MMGNKSTSLDAPVGEDGDMTLGDTIAAQEFRTDELAEQNNRSKLFNKAMNNSLSAQEKEIIKLYFGFKMDSDLNLKEIALTSTKTPIIVKCATDSPHKALVDVLDICYRHGLFSVSIFTL